MEKKSSRRRKYRSSSHHFLAKPRKSFRAREFGRAGQDILCKYGGFGENPDTVIATKGMSHLDDIERDTHLSSSLATRRAKLIKKGWRIVPFDQAEENIYKADFVNYNLINMQGSFEKDLEGTLDAIGKGFSLTEINYEWIKYQGVDYIGLKNLRYKEPKLFSFKFDELGYFKINQIDPDPGGVELPGDKFVHIIMGPNDENPYGRSVDAECAFWVWVKKNIAKFWAIFAEKFGMPLSMVKIPRNASVEDIDKIGEILDAIQEETGIQVPDGFEISFLEAVRNGEAGYERFIEICNKEISKRVFGATLIAEEGKRGQGSYALGQEHSEIFEEYVTFDAAVLEAAISEQLIKRLIDFNWDTDQYPRFEFVEFSVGIFISFSQAIQNLVNAGMKIPVKWAHKMSRIPEPRDGEDILKPVKTEQIPAKPPDNKTKMDEFREFFKENAEAEEVFRDIDKLSERYQALMAEQYEKFIAALKKKS